MSQTVEQMAEALTPKVVVNAADLKWALDMIDGEWTGTNGSLLRPTSQTAYDRLSDALDAA